MATAGIDGRRPQRGLNLIELMAVTGLLVLVVVFIAALIPSFKMSNRRANMELLASNLAQSTIDELKARDFDAIVASAQPLSKPVQEIPFTVDVAVEDLPPLAANAATTNGIASITVDAADGTAAAPLPVNPSGATLARGKAVRVVVRWTWKERPYSVTRQTLIARVLR